MYGYAIQCMLALGAGATDGAKEISRLLPRVVSYQLGGLVEEGPEEDYYQGSGAGGFASAAGYDTGYTAQEAVAPAGGGGGFYESQPPGDGGGLPAPPSGDQPWDTSPGAA